MEQIPVGEVGPVRVGAQPDVRQISGELHPQNALEILAAVKLPGAHDLRGPNTLARPPVAGVRVPPLQLGIGARSEQVGKLSAFRVVVDDDQDPTAREDALNLAETGDGSEGRVGEEVGEAGVNDVDRAVVEGNVLGGPVENATPTGPAPGAAEQRRIGFDTDDACGVVVARQPSSRPAAEIEQRLTTPVRLTPQGPPQRALVVDRGVLHIVEIRVAGLVRGRREIGEAHGSTLTAGQGWAVGRNDRSPTASGRSVLPGCRL